MDSLKQAGCIKIFTDKLTGSRMDRPGWEELLKYIRPDDTLVVTELSRMTRSLLHLLETAKILEQRQINLLSLRESIDPHSYRSLFSIDDGGYPPNGTRIMCRKGFSRKSLR